MVTERSSEKSAQEISEEIEFSMMYNAEREYESVDSDEDFSSPSGGYGLVYYFMRVVP